MSADARRYAKIRYKLVGLNLVLSWCVLGIAQASGLSHAMAGWWSSRLTGQPTIIAGYLAMFGTGYYAALLPLHFYGGFVLEHRFGLSRMTVRQWLVRELKQIFLSAAFGLLLIQGLYLLLRHSPTYWPLFATAGWIGVSIVLARILPTWLIPIFYKMTPLTDQVLVQRLLALCQRVRLKALGVWRLGLGAETRKANAALVGLGGTRRVLVSDTLLEHFDADEIETVLAHELGHHRYHHIGKLLLISAIGSWVAFAVLKILATRWVTPLGLSSVADIAGFPAFMLALSVLGVIGMPLQNGLSRHYERQADRFAIETAMQPQAFAHALQKLGDLNLADPNPPAWIEWLLYDHPAIAKRIRDAEARSAISPT